MIRPATDADFVRIAELLSIDGTEPETAEALLEYISRFPAEGTLRYLVVELPEEGVVSCGRVLRRPNEPEGRISLSVTTDPAFRNRGYGQALFDALQVPGATSLRAGIRENNEAGLTFAAKRGFRIVHRTFESVLDLEAVDVSGFEETITKCERAGIRLFSLADTAMDEAALRRAWSVNVETGADQPDAVPTPMSFEHWRDGVSKARWFAPEGQIFAAVGDEWVGLGAVGEVAPGRYYNLFTGVRRAHRGNGIAKALKALGIRYAKSRGGKTLLTDNHSDNAPMLVINRWFGYRPLPSWITVEKEISLAT